MQDRETALSDVEQKELTYLLDKMLLEGFTAREREIARAVAELVFKHTAEWPRAALASPGDAPPQEPTGASPQAETSANVRAVTVHICDDCLNLRGEMCNEPGCRFCRRTMVEVADYLDVLLIRPRIDGVSVLIDEGSHLPAPVSPVEPTTDLAIIEKCNARARQTATFLSNLEGIVRGGDFLLEAERQIAAAMMAAYVMARPASPVEQEPPTEAQFGEYERLKRQAREIEKALREAGCPAMPLEQGVRWLANKDFTAPLPPRPPAVVKPHRYDLVRYGVTWEGQDNQPLLTPMPDGYWTPWHLAVEAPTVEPEPCVWRITSGPLGTWVNPTCVEGAIPAPWGTERAKACHLCGAPLKVEREP